MREETYDGPDRRAGRTDTDRWMQVAERLGALEDNHETAQNWRAGITGALDELRGKVDCIAEWFEIRRRRRAAIKRALRGLLAVVKWVVAVGAGGVAIMAAIKHGLGR